jgi:hypothetical protein
MRDALNATGVPFFFSLCGWEQWYAPMCHALGNSCRIGGDDTNWRGVLSDIDAMAPLYPFAGPGGFMDPCLLLGRDSRGNVAVTDLQGRAQFSMWATLAAPMLLSSNVRNLTAMQRETYLNAEVIAVGQDVLGRQGQRLVGGPLSGGGASPPATASACAPGSAAQAWALDAPSQGYIQNVGGLCLNTDVRRRARARAAALGEPRAPPTSAAPPSLALAHAHRTAAPTLSCSSASPLAEAAAAPRASTSSSFRWAQTAA